MADDIERIIYRISIDDSEYTQGVDKLSTATSKLTAEQAKANTRLAELQKLNQAFKKSFQEVATVLKENEKETIALTKDLNLLKESGKGASAEAKSLQGSLRGLAVSTKEFRSEASVLKTNIAATTKEIAIQTKQIDAAQKSNSGFTSGLSKTYSGLRAISNLIPGIGIGGLVALISGPLVNAFQKWFQSADSVSKLTKDITDNAIKGYSGELTRLNLIRSKLDDLTIPQEKRVALAKEYNKTAEEGNKIDLKQIDNIDLINSAIDRQIVKIKQRALAKAAENIIADKAEKLLLAQEDAREKNLDFSIQATTQIVGVSDEQFVNVGGKLIKFKTGQEAKVAEQAAAQRKLLADAISKDPKVIAAQKDLETALTAASPFITIEGLFSDTKVDKIKASSKEITNIYEQELQKLKADIAKLDEKGFTDEGTIAKSVEEDFKKRTIAFDKAFKNKQLTEGQLNSLKDYATKLQELTLAASLKSFREQRATYLQQINDEITNLQIEESTKRIATIQESFERDRQTIITEADKTIQAVSQRRDKLISDITKNAAKSGLTPADIAPQIQSIKDIYGKLLDDLGVIKNQKLQQLSFDTFEKLSEDAKRLLDAGNLGVSQGSLVNIKEQAQLLAEGKITYEQYQKELTAIAKFEVNERFKLEKLFLEQEINLRRVKLATDKTLTDDQIKRLQDEIRSLEQQLANAEKGNITANTEAPGNDSRIDKIVRYTQAIGELARNVISFWQQANEAESAALDRSIEIQERRVSAAQRVADRGNAQYLKQEQDRLDQLNVQRENAARKQLGINAALQASEILVSLISGIAQGVKIGGPLGAIVSVAAIAAAIAGAFAIADSLKPPVPSFFVGTKDTGRGGTNDNKGGFNATLHPNEAVIPADRNKTYHPTIEAVYDKTIPAEDLNRFVKTYHKIKRAPQPNYQLIKESAEFHVSQDGKMNLAITEQNKLIQENNELQRQTLKAMSKMSISANIDRDGVAIMVNEWVQQKKIDSKI